MKPERQTDDQHGKAISTPPRLTLHPNLLDRSVNKHWRATTWQQFAVDSLYTCHTKSMRRTFMGNIPHDCWNIPFPKQLRECKLQNIELHVWGEIMKPDRTTDDQHGSATSTTPKLTLHPNYLDITVHKHWRAITWQKIKADSLYTCQNYAKNIDGKNSTWCQLPIYTPACRPEAITATTYI